MAFLKCVLAENAQFYDSDSKLGFALSTSQNSNATDLLFQISASKAAGWGAVGIGGGMTGALMFIIYPSTQENGESSDLLHETRTVYQCKSFEMGITSFHRYHSQCKVCSVSQISCPHHALSHSRCAVVTFHHRR